MTALYLAVLLAWLAVAALMIPSVVGVYRGTARTNDGAGIMCLAWALLMAFFIGRRVLVDPAADPSLVALMVASLAVAVMTFRTAWRYGRGARA